MGEMQRAAFCSSCGHAAKEGAKFCGKCGSEVASVPSTDVACASCGQKAEDPTDRFCSGCGTAMPARSERTCSKPECGAPLGSDFKFCAVCGAPASAPEPPPVSAFDLPKTEPAPAPKPTVSPRPIPVPRTASGGKRTGLLVAGVAVSAIGAALLGLGVYNGLAASGVLGGWQTSPATPTDSKVDVWEGIRARQEAEDAAMLKKIEEAGGAG